jgi:hypothetical protein
MIHTRHEKAAVLMSAAHLPARRYIRTLWRQHGGSPAEASTSIPHRSTPNRWPATSPQRRSRASFRIRSRSFRTAISMRLPAAIFCRCCWSRSCRASPAPFSRPASRSPTSSIRRSFGIIRMIVRPAPLGAMAFTIKEALQETMAHLIELGEALELGGLRRCQINPRKSKGHKRMRGSS